MSPDKGAGGGRSAAKGEADERDLDPVLGQIKRIYDDVAKEPLPDQLVQLLEKLDEAERRR